MSNTDSGSTIENEFICSECGSEGYTVVVIVTAVMLKSGFVIKDVQTDSLGFNDFSVVCSNCGKQPDIQQRMMVTIGTCKRLSGFLVRRLSEEVDNRITGNPVSNKDAKVKKRVPISRRSAQAVMVLPVDTGEAAEEATKYKRGKTASSLIDFDSVFDKRIWAPYTRKNGVSKLEAKRAAGALQDIDFVELVRAMSKWNAFWLTEIKAGREHYCKHLQRWIRDCGFKSDPPQPTVGVQGGLFGATGSPYTASGGRTETTPDVAQKPRRYGPQEPEKIPYARPGLKVVLPWDKERTQEDEDGEAI